MGKGGGEGADCTRETAVEAAGGDNATAGAAAGRLATCLVASMIWRGGDETDARMHATTYIDHGGVYDKQAGANDATKVMCAGTYSVPTNAQ